MNNSSWGYSGELHRKLSQWDRVSVVNCLLDREFLIILILHPLHLGLCHGFRVSQHFLFLCFSWLCCQAVHSPPQEKIWGSPAWEVVGRQQPSAVPPLATELFFYCGIEAQTMAEIGGDPRVGSCPTTIGLPCWTMFVPDGAEAPLPHFSSSLLPLQY